MIHTGNKRERIFVILKSHGVNGYIDLPITKAEVIIIIIKTLVLVII